MSDGGTLDADRDFPDADDDRLDDELVAASRGVDLRGA